MNQSEDGEIVAETENLLVWRNQEEIGNIYHIEVGTVTLHMLSEEWEELILLIKNADLKQ